MGMVAIRTSMSRDIDLFFWNGFNGVLGYNYTASNRATAVEKLSRTIFLPVNDKEPAPPNPHICLSRRGECFAHYAALTIETSVPLLDNRYSPQALFTTVQAFRLSSTKDVSGEICGRRTQ